MRSTAATGRTRRSMRARAVATSRSRTMVRSGRSGADREIIQRGDHLRLELARNALINRGRIEEAIGDNDRAVARARAGSVSRTSWLRLASKSNSSVSGVMAKLSGANWRRSRIFSPMAVPPGSRVMSTRTPVVPAAPPAAHLGRFPAALRAFECDKRAARHQSECETRGSAVVEPARRRLAWSNSVLLA